MIVIKETSFRPVFPNLKKEFVSDEGGCVKRVICFKKIAKPKIKKYTEKPNKGSWQ